MFQFNWFNKRKRKIFVGHSSVTLAMQRSGLLVAFCFALHVFCMMVFEKLGFSDAIWLTATTIMTVGYGDLSAKTDLGRASTILVLYGFGIYSVATLASSLLERRAETRELKKKGLWSWNMKNHIIIIATIRDNPDRFFERLSRQIELDPRYKNADVLLTGESFPDGLPESLSRRGWAPLRIESHALDFVDKCDAAHAVAAIVCAEDENKTSSDPMSYELCCRLSAAMPKGSAIVAECVSDSWRARMSKCAHAVARPARTYPEMLGRALCAPGSEQIVENLLDAGGETLLRVDLNFQGAWSAIGSTCLATEAGLPLAYQSVDGQVVSNPKPSARVHAKAIFLVAPEGSEPIELARAIQNHLGTTHAVG